MKSLFRITLTMLVLATLLVACGAPAATEDPTNAINTAVAGT